MFEERKRAVVLVEEPRKASKAENMTWPIRTSDTVLKIGNECQTWKGIRKTYRHWNNEQETTARGERIERSKLVGGRGVSMSDNREATVGLHIMREEEDIAPTMHISVTHLYYYVSETNTRRRSEFFSVL